MKPKYKIVRQPDFVTDSRGGRPGGVHTHIPFAALKVDRGVLIPMPADLSGRRVVSSYAVSQGRRLHRKFTTRASLDKTKLYVGRIK